MKPLFLFLFAFSLFAIQCPAQDQDFPAWLTPPGIIYPTGPLFIPSYALGEIQKKAKSLRIKQADIGGEQYFFDKEGNLLSHKIKNGRGVKYFYDGLGKLTRTESWEMVAEQEDFRIAVFYSYAENGELESIRILDLKNPSKNLEDNTWRFEMSKDGGYVKAIHPEAGKGNLFAIYAFDEKKRLTRFSRSTDTDTPGMEWVYDASGTKITKKQVTRDTSLVVEVLEFDDEGKMIASQIGIFQHRYTYTKKGLIEKIVTTLINHDEPVYIWQLEYDENGLAAKQTSRSLTRGSKWVKEIKRYKYKFYKEDE